jgi:ADP-ribose pyrophosphatase
MTEYFPKRLSRETIYKSPWINLYADEVEMPSGKIIERYHILDFPKKSVIVVPYMDNFILFVESLRYSQGKTILELPAGSIEKGEDLFSAAKREILEETGYDIKDLKKIYSVNSINGMSKKQDYILKGEITKKISDTLDKDEIKKTEWLSFNETKKLIHKGKIKDGLALNALLLFLNQSQLPQNA